MIRNPINMYPYNNPIDISVENTFHFNFQGDRIESLTYAFIGNQEESEIGKVVVTDPAIGNLINATFYNGNKISFIVPPYFGLTDSFNSSMFGRTFFFVLKQQASTEEIAYTPKYYFKALHTPELSLTFNGKTFTTATTFEASSHYMDIIGNYSQKENVGIKNYSFYLYDTNNVLLDKKENIYSLDIKYQYSGLESGKTYRLHSIIATQENQVLEEDRNISVTYVVPNNNLVPFVINDKNKNAIKIGIPRIRVSKGKCNYVSYNEDQYLNLNTVYTSNGIQPTQLSYSSVNLLPLEVDYNNFGIATRVRIPLGTNGEILSLQIDNHFFTVYAIYSIMNFSLRFIMQEKLFTPPNSWENISKKEVYLSNKTASKEEVVLILNKKDINIDFQIKEI